MFTFQFRFLEFLSGQRLEEEYVRIVSQSSDLLKELQAADEEGDGTISPIKLEKVLKSVFPLKSTSSLENLQSLFGTDPEVSVYSYNSIIAKALVQRSADNFGNYRIKPKFIQPKPYMVETI